MDVINDYLQKHKTFKTFPVVDLVIRELAPQIKCKDGFRMSVQVSHTHYCQPRVDDAPRYFSAEIGFPSEVEPLILEYAEDKDTPTGTVYGEVPVDVINQVIEKHGGIKC